MPEAEIIAKFTSQYEVVFAYAHKFAAYMNQLFADQIDAKIFLETIAGGLIYFYNSVETFSAMIMPYNPKTVARYKRQRSKGKQVDIFLLPTLDAYYKTHSTERVEATFEFVKGPVEELMEPTIAHFKSYSPQEMEVSQEGESTIVIRFLTKNAVNLYLEERSLMLAGLMKDYFNSQ